MPSQFAHLRLKTWPFSIVPRPEFCNFLAGRTQLREDIHALLRGLSRRDTSSIHIFWSWLGAGKTHSLYYLADQAAKVANSGSVVLCPIYSEFPKRARGFIDLYRSAVLLLGTQLLTDSFLEATTSPSGSSRLSAISDAEPDLATAFRLMTMGSAYEQSIAIRWLRGDALAISELRKIGISQRIDTTDQAVRILSALVETCLVAARSRGLQGFRMIWLLDEFQRLQRCPPSIVRDVNAGLHSLFNSCPIGLSLIISFSGPPDAKHLPDWLSPELRDRIGATKVMVLPPFERAAALKFIVEVLDHFRLPNETRKCGYFPFTKDACEFVLGYLEKSAGLRPRNIMHALNAVLEAADPMIEQGNLNEIDPKFAQAVLRDYVVVSDDEADAE